jgi:hypothetical protein
MRKRKSGRFRVWWIIYCVTILGWPGSGHSAAQAGVLTLSCHLPSASVPVAGQTELFLEIQNVQNLYGYELVLRYDPTLIEFVDAEPLREGVNTQLSNFLSPDFVVLNDIDPPGELWLNLTQIDPTAARSGSSPLARAIVTGLQDGIANFTITDLILYDVAGNEIPYQVQNCALQVGPPPSPTESPTLPPGTPTLAPPTTTPTQAPPTVAAVDTSISTVVPTATPAPPTEVPPTFIPTGTLVTAATPTPTFAPATTTPSAAAPADTPTLVPAATAIATAAVAVFTADVQQIAPTGAVTSAAIALNTTAFKLLLPYISNVIEDSFSQAPAPTTGSEAAATIESAATITAEEQIMLPLVTPGGAQESAMVTLSPQPTATLNIPAPVGQQQIQMSALSTPMISLAWLFPLGFTLAGLGFLGLTIAAMVYISSRSI